MDAIDAILSRRSIREYKEEPLPDIAIYELVKVAMAAPSAGNEQPWHFVIINDRRILDHIQEFHPYSEALKTASTAILICGDKNLERHEGCWALDCSAATENILIAARAKGLGAVWLGIYPLQDRMDGMRSLLNIPENAIPFSLVPVGYPVEERLKENRYSIYRIHLNGW